MTTSAQVRVGSAPWADSGRAAIPRRDRWFKCFRPAYDRTGAAALEFAIVAPLLLLIVFGIVEFGRMIMVQQILTNASREGARRAVIENVSNAEVVDLVNNYLSNSSISGATVTVDPLDLSLVGFGDPVTVSVEVPFDAVSWGGASWFLGGSTFSSSSTMRGERLQ